MGRDGGAGLLRIREAGGATLVQDRESAVVYGMPAHALAVGAADESVELGSIAAAIESHVQRRLALDASRTDE